MNGHPVIGVDVGGTKIAAGLALLPEGRVLARRLIRTEAARGGRAVLDDALGLARELAKESADLGVSAKAIGVGLCELVDREGRVASENCVAWMNLRAREELSAIAQTIFEADVRAAALAEARFGAGKDLGCFLYVTVGTGISCCLMIDGRPYLGANGFTGTMASGPLSVPCPSCGEVNDRTLEDVAAGPALVARFRAEGGAARGGQEVLAAANAGDPSAKRVIETAADALASQVGMLVSALDPEAVVLGGGLGLSEGPYRERFLESVRRHIWSPRQRDLPFLFAALGADAGWLGAAHAAWEHRS